MAKDKKLHGRAFYESLGSPKHVLAPMVDQSEFAWRLLTRSFLPPELRTSILCYSPMLHAKLFADAPKYRASHFEATKPTDAAASENEGEAYLDGNAAIGDRPLFVQFCANDPDTLLQAAKVVQPHCDAVDLNLGCPQGIAKRGHYGAFLQEDWDTIYKMINNLHNNLDIPVTAKMRVLETKERTLAYAQMILSAGASILTVHGRQREQKGHKTGLADWSVLRYLREKLPPETVLFANGNILQYGDIERCLQATGFDGVMSAEGNLYDPAIFAAPPEVGDEGREYWRGRDGKGGYRMDAVLRRYLDIVHTHVMGRHPPERAPLFLPSDEKKPAEPQPHSTNGETVKDADETDTQPSPKKQQKREASQEPPQPATTKKQKQDQPSPTTKQQPKKAEKCTNPNLVAMQAHCFHLLRPLVAHHHNVRDALARSRAGDLDAYENVLTLTEIAVREGLLAYEEDPSAFETPPEGDGGDGVGCGREDEGLSSDAAVRRCKRPYWVCQAYVRPLPKEALEKGSLQLSKKELRRLEREREESRRSGVVPEGKVERVGVEVEAQVREKADGGEERGKGKKEAEVKVPREGMVCG